jgi:hypothetical protein
MHGERIKILIPLFTQNYQNTRKDKTTAPKPITKK